ARPGIVVKINTGPTRTQGGFSNHLAVTAGAQYGQSLHSLLPVNFGMVASPSALMPSRAKTLRMVRYSILMSNQILRLSTYHTSNANFSSQEIALRPLT